MNNKITKKAIKLANIPLKTLTSFINLSPWSKPILIAEYIYHKTDKLSKMLYTGKKNSERIIDVIESPKTPTLTLKNIICHLTQQAQLIKYLIQHVTQKESILEREYDQF